MAMAVPTSLVTPAFQEPGLPLSRRVPHRPRARSSPSSPKVPRVAVIGCFASLWRHLQRWRREQARRDVTRKLFGFNDEMFDCERRQTLAKDFGMGKVQLDITHWLEEAQLDENLAKDVMEKFGSVPQQADEVVADVVQRIQSGAQKCVAPSSIVHPFGSTVNGFGEESSDLDVLVAIKEEELSYYMSYASWAQKHQRLSEFLLPDSPTEPLLPTRITSKMAMSHAVQQLADFLPELGFKVLNLLPQARKPLVTVEDMQGPLKEIDVSINNSLPLYNSQLLKAYSELDERVRPLVLLVKVWAKGKRVCGAGEGNLSSYSWTIMVIYFMQLVGILPSLQLLQEGSRILSHSDYWGHPRKFETAFLTAKEYKQAVADQKIPPCQAEADLTVAQLLYGFVRFFALEYQWGNETVSMRSPERREPNEWMRFFGTVHPEAMIHIEDPIEFRDLNIVLRRERLAQLKEEFNHALQMLEDGCSLEEFLTRDPRPDVILIPLRTKRRINRRRQRSVEIPRLPELK